MKSEKGGVELGILYLRSGLHRVILGCGETPRREDQKDRDHESADQGGIRTTPPMYRSRSPSMNQ